MQRRNFLRLTGVASAWPLVARAQPKRKLGVLMIVAENDAEGGQRIAAFRQGLRDLGWTDGENIHVEYRWGAGRPELIRQYAQELVALAPDVIVANGNPAINALNPLTRSIPIVCALITDPVGFGFAKTLSRPGGNITGFSFINPELVGKWTALIKDAAPGVNRAALLYNPEINSFWPSLLRGLAAVPQSLAMEVAPITAESMGDVRRETEALGRTPGASLIIGPDAFMIVHMREVAELAAANRLPGISVYRQFAVDGGLMSYGADVPDIFRRAADYVDRILKGANPAELPVQQPTKFEFIVNQKAAAALGLKLSPTLLSLADEVIE